MAAPVPNQDGSNPLEQPPFVDDVICYTGEPVVNSFLSQNPNPLEFTTLMPAGETTGAKFEHKPLTLFDFQTQPRITDSLGRAFRYSDQQSEFLGEVKKGGEFFLDDFNITRSQVRSGVFAIGQAAVTGEIPSAKSVMYDYLESPAGKDMLEETSLTFGSLLDRSFGETFRNDVQIGIRATDTKEINFILSVHTEVDIGKWVWDNPFGDDEWEKACVVAGYGGYMENGWSIPVTADGDIDFGGEAGFNAFVGLENTPYGGLRLGIEQPVMWWGDSNPDSYNVYATWQVPASWGSNVTRRERWRYRRR